MQKYKSFNYYITVVSTAARAGILIAVKDLHPNYSAFAAVSLKLNPFQFKQQNLVRSWLMTDRAGQTITADCPPIIPSVCSGLCKPNETFMKIYEHHTVHVVY